MYQLKFNKKIKIKRKIKKEIYLFLVNSKAIDNTAATKRRMTKIPTKTT